MSTLHARNVSFETIQVGDALPILIKEESQHSINQYRKLAVIDPGDGWKDLHTDADFAQQGIFGGTVNIGMATVGYVAELLEKAFPVRAVLAAGAKLEMQARQPFRAGDVVSFSGRVVGKREDAGKRLVDIEITGANDKGQVIAKGTATVVL